MKEKKLLIEARNLSKSYQRAQGNLQALSEINLEVYAGDSVAVMGPSGSGKSTLLHLLGCLDHPTSGTYFFNQQDVLSLDDTTLSSMRASQIGFVFQSHYLIPHLTVYENLQVPFQYQKESLSNKKIKERIAKVIEYIGLQKRVDHYPSQLSGGESQRVAIARALVIEPLIILADEPTGNLDSENGKSVLKIFSDLNANGTTLLIVTHAFDVAAICQRTVKMKDGRQEKNK